MFSYGDLSPSSPLPKPRFPSEYWIFCSVPSSRLLHIVMEVRIEQLYVQLMEALMVTFVRLYEYATGQVGDTRLGREFGRLLLEKAPQKSISLYTNFDRLENFKNLDSIIPFGPFFFVKIWNALVYNTQTAEGKLRRNPAIFWCHRRNAKLCIIFITISIFISPARSTYKGIFCLESGNAVVFYVGLWCKYDDSGQRARRYTSAMNVPTSFFTPSLVSWLSLGSQFPNLSFPLETFFGQMTKFPSKLTPILYLVGYFHKESLHRMGKKGFTDVRLC